MQTLRRPSPVCVLLNGPSSRNRIEVETMKFKAEQRMQTVARIPYFAQMSNIKNA